MALKYKLTSVPNKKYDKEHMNYLRKVISALKGVNTVKPPEESCKGLLGDVAEITETTTSFRQVLKELESVPPELQQLHVTSDRSWSMYPEVVDDETGCTKYEKKTEFKVDIKLDYNRHIGVRIKDTVKEIQDSAMQELKDYRKQSKAIAYIEKDYTSERLKGLPIRPKYKVYAGSGFGGPGGEVRYKDTWRGTDIKTVIPEGNSNYNIHMEGGTFLELNKLTKVRRVFEAKKPKTNANHVGIEIEFISKYDKDKLALFLMEENVQEYVHLLDDGSLRKEKDYPFMHEITILAPEQLIYVILESVLKAINRDNGSKVNARCGIHVHLDMRTRDKTMSFHNLQKAQRIMYSMNPRQRLDGTSADGSKGEIYSKRVEVSDINQMINNIAGGNNRHDRYYGINVLALEKHKTLEIRIHSGSLNYTKISNWVKILTSVVNTTTYVETEAAKAETFCQYYNLDNTMVGYINERMAKFKDKNGKHISVDECA